MVQKGNKRSNSIRLLLTGAMLLCIFSLQAQKPSDPLATQEARHLYAGLDRLSKAHTLFGHQDAGAKRV